MNFEPIYPGGIGAIFQDVAKEEETPTGMVEYSVENDFDISLMGLL